MRILNFGGRLMGIFLICHRMVETRVLQASRIGKMADLVRLLYLPEMTT